MSQNTGRTPAQPTLEDERRVLKAFRSTYAHAQDGDRLEIRFAGGTIHLRRRRPASRDATPTQDLTDSSDHLQSDAITHWQDDGGLS